MPAWAGGSGCSSQQGTTARRRSGRGGGARGEAAARGSRRRHELSKAVDGGGAVLRGQGRAGDSGARVVRGVDEAAVLGAGTTTRRRGAPGRGRRGGGAPGQGTTMAIDRRRLQTDQENHQVLGRRQGRRAPGYIGWEPLVPVPATTRDQRVFGPGSWLHPGPKGVLAGRGENAFAAHL